MQQLSAMRCLRCKAMLSTDECLLCYDCEESTVYEC